MSDYSELKKQAEAADSALEKLDRPEDLQLELVLRGKSRPKLAELTDIAAFWEKSSPGAVLALITDNERLERNRDMWKVQVERQAEEMTALRKDADRYRWLRVKQTFIWLIQDWLPSNAVLTDVDAEIDSAMSKRAQSRAT